MAGHSYSTTRHGDDMIRMTGLKEIDRVIKQLPHQLTHPILQQIHAEALKPFVTAAYFAAPLDSGRTAKSIGTIKPARKRVDVVGTVISGPRRSRRYKGHYAHWIEFGTKERELDGKGKYRKGTKRGAMPRQPFVEPSWNRTNKQVEEGIRLATGRVIYRFMRRTIKQYG